MWKLKGKAGRPAVSASWQGYDYLDLVPRKLVEAAPSSDGGAVSLLVPRYRDAIWGRLLQPRLGPGKRFVKVPLEARGAALWTAIDGQRTVRDLVPVVGEVAPDDLDNLPRRVCLFVQAMADNGFIALDRPAPAGQAAGSAETT